MLQVVIDLDGQQKVVKFLTYKTNVSLYVGDQLLFFDLVEFLRRFPLRLGPTMFTSTKGRNIPKNKIERALMYFLVLRLFFIVKL